MDAATPVNIREGVRELNEGEGRDDPEEKRDHKMKMMVVVAALNGVWRSSFGW